MKEIKEIIAAYDNAVAQNKKTALATVVHVDGSSYRRPGARMLVTEDGLITGAISGGCLEGDALRKALLALHQNKNKLVTYDTSDEGDTLGVQLGCNGIVHILFEPIDPSGKNVMDLLKLVNTQRNPAAVTTLFAFNNQLEQPGTVMAMVNDQATFTSSASMDEALKETLLEDSRLTIQTGISSVKSYSRHQLEVSMQVVPAPISIIIFGAGNDAIPLAEISQRIGWTVTIVDGRPTHATKTRFPSADNIYVVKSSEAVDTLTFDNTTAAVLMTHNYNYDLIVLKQLLSSPCPYIGLLGPRTKFDRMIDDLAQEGIRLDKNDPRIFAPVGLELGAETSEEIALSITSEIKAVFSGGSAQSLKAKTGPIHTRKAMQQEGSAIK